MSSGVLICRSSDLTLINVFFSNQSVLVESPVSLAVSPGVISLDPSVSLSPISAPPTNVSSSVGRKGGGGGKKGKKKKDPNEPQKPVSAYALFFRDTQAAIKGQNPNATFGEVSKIVASMWDSLGEEQKQVGVVPAVTEKVKRGFSINTFLVFQVYKRKNEAAKKDYFKALAEYRDSQNTTQVRAGAQTFLEGGILLFLDHFFFTELVT